MPDLLLAAGGPPARRTAARQDPTMFVGALAVYAAVVATSLLLPGRVFDIDPVYRVARSLGLPENVWGLTMLGDACALRWTIMIRVSSPVRSALASAVALVSGVLWLFWGACLLLSAAQVGFFSVAGAWSVAAGIGCFQATMRWIVQRSA